MTVDEVPARWRAAVLALLETAQGRTIMSECIGAFPDMTPPEPESEPDGE